MTALDAPSGTARVVLTGTLAELARGRPAEYRHRGITIVERPTAVGALLELAKEPGSILLVRSDIKDMALPDVLDLAHHVAKSRVVLGLAADVSVDTVGMAIRHGAATTIPLPLTADRLAGLVRFVLPYHPDPRVLDVGSLHLDPGRFEVSWRGIDVDLAQREFELLATLMANHPRAVRLVELVDALGVTGNDPESSVRVSITKLRTRLENACSTVDVPIQTVRGVGYRLTEGTEARLTTQQ